MMENNKKWYTVTFTPVVHITIDEDGVLLEKSIDFGSSWTGDILRYDNEHDDDDAEVVEDIPEINRIVGLADDATWSLNLEQRFIHYKEFGNEPF
jgi:hypothetical protein